MASLLCMCSLTVNKDKAEFDLDEINGSESYFTLGPFENVTVSGLLKGPLKHSS